jgi:hypothetical protein
MKRVLVASVALLAIVAVPGVMFAGPITSLSDTGQGITPGLSDPTFWKVSGGQCPPSGAAGCTPGTAYSNSNVVVPFDAALVIPISTTPPWYTGTGTGVGFDPNSQWVVPSVRNDGTVKYSSNTDPVGGPMDFGTFTYTFKTTFNIAGSVDPGTQLTGVWWADGHLDAACGIRLNGNCNSVVNPGAPTTYGSTSGTFFAISSGFVVGTNTVEFLVSNADREVGLRVNFGSASVPEPSSLLMMGAGLLALAVRRKK